MRPGVVGVCRRQLAGGALETGLATLETLEERLVALVLIRRKRMRLVGLLRRRREQRRTHQPVEHVLPPAPDLALDRAKRGRAVADKVAGGARAEVPGGTPEVRKSRTAAAPAPPPPSGPRRAPRVFPRS